MIRRLYSFGLGGIEFYSDRTSYVRKYTVSKRIELESPGCSGLEKN